MPNKMRRACMVTGFRRRTNMLVTFQGKGRKFSWENWEKPPNAPVKKRVFDFHRAVHRNIISIVKPTRCTNVSNLFYFWNDALHVSDGLSVHHQEFKTVHTATGICQTDTAVFELAVSCYRCRVQDSRVEQQRIESRPPVS